VTTRRCRGIAGLILRPAARQGRAQHRGVQGDFGGLRVSPLSSAVFSTRQGSDFQEPARYNLGGNAELVPEEGFEPPTKGL
jgi:hypothetical protein